MGKMNIANINTGLDKVKSITKALANVARYELVPIEYFELADYNPFSDEDTDESRYSLAMSIQASGLIEPVAANKKSDTKYKLISGEHRISAIKQYLPGFKQIPCMVFENITDIEAKLKLYEANGYREYTTEQKFKIYQELSKLLSEMKDSGKFSGSIQKGIAERLGMSTHQVRKYTRIVENLSEEQQQQIINGELSIDKAYQISQPSTVPDEVSNESQIVDKSGRPSDFYESPPTNALASPLSETLQGTNTGPTNMRNEKTDQPTTTEVDREQSTKFTTDFDHCFWDDKIKYALKHLYNEKSIFLYYVFQVPTTQEAIKEILKPSCGYSGCSVIFPDKVSGFCDCRSAQMEIQYKKERTVLTYSQVDGYIREMIRSGEWIAETDARAAIKGKLKL